MAQLLKQSTLVTIRLGPALDKTDGVTEEIALSPTVEISKNHGAFAARNSATAITHDSNGWYAVELNATDTNTLGPFIAKFDDAATHLPVWREFLVVPANVYDSFVGGTDTLQADLTQVNGAAQTATLDTIKTETASIQTDTNDLQTQIGTAGAGLTNLVNLIWDELTAEARTAGSYGQLVKDNLNATVGSRAIPGDLMGLVADAITSAKIAADAFGALEMATDAVNEIRDAIFAKIVSERAQVLPPVTPTFDDFVGWLWMAWRNETTRTAGQENIKNDLGTVIAKSTLADDGTTFTRGKRAAGP